MNAYITNKITQAEWETFSLTIEHNFRFITHGWLKSWTAHLALSNLSSSLLNYLCVCDESGEKVAIFPFIYNRSYAFTTLILAGYPLPFKTILVSKNHSKEIFNYAVKYLLEKRKVAALYFNSVYNDTYLYSFIQVFKDYDFMIEEINSSDIFVIELPNSYDEFYRKIGGKKLKKADYYLRRMNKTGNAFIKHFKEENLDIELVDELAKIESQAWVNSGGSPRFLGTCNEKFWKELLQDALFCKFVTCWVLYYTNKPVSFCFAIDSGAYRYVLANSYIEEVSKYSTGLILYKEMLEDAFLKKIKVVNLGTGDSGYKARWGAKIIPHQISSYQILRPGVIGWAYATFFKMKNVVKSNLLKEKNNEIS